MNRVQAIKAVADKIGLSGPFTNNLVDAMVAVGVLKLEDDDSRAIRLLFHGLAVLDARLEGNDGQHA